jgi:putative methyltransferase (TIGR04325 family)
MEKFTLHGAYDFSRMLQSCIDGKINSWSVKWLAVAILENKLSLYPKYTVSKHIGIDKNATHQHEENYENMMIFPKSKINVEPQEVRTIPFVYDEIRRAFFKINAPKPTEITFNQQIKFILKDILPPFLLKILSRLRRGNVSNHNHSPLLVSTTYLGNYSTWEEAQAHCEGYDAPQILEKVKSAILKVKNGEAIYERDSVLFDKIQYSWGLLSGLLRAAAENEGNLSLIDFGGSLGSTYFQCRSFLRDLKSLDWNIVEQKHFVEAGKKEIEDKNLHFFYNIDEVLAAKKVNVLLLSSVLPHLENPYQWLNLFFEKKIKYLIIDRTSFCKPYGELLTIQYVPEKIEKASYLTWFFDEDKFLAHIEVYYEKIADFPSYCDNNYQLENEKTGIWKGFIFRLKD